MSEPTAERSVPKPDVRVVLVLPLLVFLAYANTLDNGFVHDDRQEILENTYIKGPESIGTILTSSSWAFEHEEGAREVSNYYRPVQYLVYMGLWATCGEAPFGYHLFKLLLHALTAVLVYLLLLRLAGSLRVAALGALLFAVHPMSTEAVAWISGITDALSAPLAIGCFLLFVRAADGRAVARSLAGAYTLFLVGMFAKESVVMLPALLLLAELALDRRRLDLRLLARYLPFAAIVAFYLACRVAAIGAFTMTRIRFASLSGWQCLLNWPYLLASYLKMYLLPVEHNAFRLLDPIVALADPRLVLSVVVLAAAAAVAVAVRRTMPALSYGLAWFGLALLPVVLFFRHIGENVVTERYLYLPGVGGALLLASLLGQVRSTAVSRVLAGLLLAVFAVATVARNDVWQDELTFYSATARASPAALPMRFDLANALMATNRPARAIREYRAAAALRPDFADLHYNLANAYQKVGRRDEAVRHYREAVRLRPDHASYRTNLGNAYYLAGDLLSALEQYQEAARLAPRDALAHSNLGNVLSSLGLKEPALEQYLQAVRLDPAFFEARANLGILYQEMGRQREAVACFRTAIRLRPGSEAAGRLRASEQALAARG